MTFCWGGLVLGGLWMEQPLPVHRLRTVSGSGYCLDMTSGFGYVQFSGTCHSNTELPLERLIMAENNEALLDGNIS